MMYVFDTFRNLSLRMKFLSEKSPIPRNKIAIGKVPSKLIKNALRKISFKILFIRLGSCCRILVLIRTNTSYLCYIAPEIAVRDIKHAIILSHRFLGLATPLFKFDFFHVDR